MGIGMAVVVPAADASRAVEIANQHGANAVIIGTVTDEPGIHISRPT